MAMLPADELFSDGKLIPLQLSSIKCERAHPPKNHIAHPPENHWPIMNPSARLDQVQGGSMAALSSLSLPLLHLAFVAGLGFFGGGGVCWLCLLGVGHGVCSKFVGFMGKFLLGCGSNSGQGGGGWWFQFGFGAWLASWFGSSFVVWFVIYWWVWSLWLSLGSWLGSDVVVDRLFWVLDFFVWIGCVIFFDWFDPMRL